MTLKTKLLSVFILMSFFSCASSEKKLTDEDYIAIQNLNKKVSEVSVPSCTSTKEYITTLEFLRKGGVVILKESQARELADQVSKGCTGAAHRFARVATILVKAGVGGSDAVKSALKFVHQSDQDSNAFVEVFKYAYLKAYLDMSLVNSARVAHMLSNEFDGEKENVLSDFKEMTSFCKNKEELKIPKPECGLLAGEVAKGGQNTGKSVFSDFEELYEFLISDSGPKMTPIDAAKLAKDMVGISPVSVPAFIQAYRFSTSKNGLSMNKDQSMKFAKDMANRSKHPKVK